MHSIRDLITGSEYKQDMQIVILSVTPPLSKPPTDRYWNIQLELAITQPAVQAAVGQ